MSTIIANDISEKIQESITEMETTIAVMGALSKDSQKKVMDYSLEILREENNPFKPKTEEELIAAVHEGVADIEAGRYKDIDVACDEIAAELGL